MSKMEAARRVTLVTASTALILSLAANVAGQFWWGNLLALIGSLSMVISLACYADTLYRDKNQLKNDLSEMRSLLREANCDGDFERSNSERIRTERDAARKECDVFKTERNISRFRHAGTKRKLAAARGRITKFKKQVAEWQ